VSERLEPLADGVFRMALRTPTLPPATATNLMIAGRSKLALIEPATPHEEERRVLDQVLEQLAAQGRRVAMLLVTHHHADHIGDVERLRQRHSVPLLAHAATAARLPFAVDRELSDGEQLDLGEGMSSPRASPTRVTWSPGRGRSSSIRTTRATWGSTSSRCGG
jgi:glyoxylase-like metal-dependent hydrolase (beta-lactamase superfamily II)